MSSSVATTTHEAFMTFAESEGPVDYKLWLISKYFDWQSGKGDSMKFKTFREFLDWEIR